MVCPLVNPKLNGEGLHGIRTREHPFWKEKWQWKTHSTSSAIQQAHVAAAARRPAERVHPAPPKTEDSGTVSRQGLGPSSVGRFRERLLAGCSGKQSAEKAAPDRLPRLPPHFA